MSATDLDALLARMPEISEAVQRFSSESIQAQVLQALLEAFGAGSNRDVGARIAQDDPDEEVDMQNKGDKPRDVKNASPKRSNGSKPKQSFTIDKNLDLVNGGTPSFRAFAEAKAPSSQVEKCLVSVYWLTRVRTSAEPATVEQVYSCYKHMGWLVPSDLANTLSKAGTMGWLDSRDRQKLTVVVAGENHLEHEMPGAKKGSER
mgnify:CR=1 FL=1